MRVFRLSFGSKVYQWAFLLLIGLLTACGDESNPTSQLVLPAPTPITRTAKPLPPSPTPGNKLTLRPLTPDSALTNGAFQTPDGQTRGNRSVWLRLAARESDLNWFEAGQIPPSLKSLPWNDEILVTANMIGGPPQLFNLKLAGAELNGRTVSLQIEVKLPPREAVIAAIAVPYVAAGLLTRSELPPGQLTFLLLDQQGQQLDQAQLSL
jgi:hypothetical protein